MIKKREYYPTSSYDEPGLTTLTHKIRIYPNRANQDKLRAYFNYNRYCYNDAVATQRDLYTKYREAKASGEYTQKELNKKFYPNDRRIRNEMTRHREEWQLRYSSRMISSAANSVYRAVKNALNPKMPNHRFPKFKKRKSTKPSAQFYKARIKDGKLYLPNARGNDGIRFTPIRMAETIRFTGEPADYCTILLEEDKWYACFTVTLDDESREAVGARRGFKLDRSGLPVIGVDVNIKHFDYNTISLTSGGDYSQVRTLTDELLTEYDRVKYYNRALARKRVKNPKDWRTSKSYRRTRIKLNGTYKRIHALQDDIINSFIKWLRFNASMVVIEDLDTKSMFMNKSLCKGLQRALFGRFKLRVQQTLVGSGVTLVMADRWFPSTQRCSACGFVKTGEDRLGLAGDAHGRGHDEFECDACGFKAGRDVNAVANLVAYGEAVVNNSSLRMVYKE